MTRPLRVLTVDDELLALRRLKIMLRELPAVEHVGEATGCIEAVERIRAERPDVVLLDIKMRDGSGFDVLDRLACEELPAVVFVSAFSHFATRAFEAAAADYVLKPVETARLAKALDQARRRIQADDAEQQIAELRAVVASLRADLEGQEGPGYEREFWIRDAKSFVRVPVDAIEWVSSEDDYVRLHTRGGSYLMRGSIRGFEARVDPRAFVRIHRRTLVRSTCVREVRRTALGAPEVVLHDDQRLRLGRVYAKRFRDALLQKDAAEPVPAAPSLRRFG